MRFFNLWAFMGGTLIVGVIKEREEGDFFFFCHGFLYGDCENRRITGFMVAANLHDLIYTGY